MNDKEIFEYQNLARQHPERIVLKLNKALQSKEMIVEYSERAIKEAIFDMSRKGPVPGLEWDEGIFKACRDHVKDLSFKGKADHRGTDGKTVRERINHYGKYTGMCGENIVISKIKPKDIVLSLIINGPLRVNTAS